MPRDSRRKWGVHTLLVNRQTDEHTSWSYAPEGDCGGYVSVTRADRDKVGFFVFVSSDDYEGTAMFPSALIPEVIRGLRKLQKAEKQQVHDAAVSPVTGAPNGEHAPELATADKSVEYPHRDSTGEKTDAKG